MGGFMLGLAIEKMEPAPAHCTHHCGKDGTSGNRIILGFILATGLIGMWLSNTATTMMMFPIALSVVHVMKENKEGGGNYEHFNLCLLLAIAYASNFGGIATIVGTPPNVQFVGAFEKGITRTLISSTGCLSAPIAVLLMLSLYFIYNENIVPQ